MDTRMTAGIPTNTPIITLTSMGMGTRTMAGRPAAPEPVRMSTQRMMRRQAGVLRKSGPE